MSLFAGTKLGPYEIQSPLGAGGMGEVYRARDTRLGRDVAIKVLNSALATNPELKARFEREARAISALQHPHICVLHDIGQESGTDFLVMEYLEGESLHDRLKRGPLPIEQVLKIAIEVADALEKAHRAGIIHRDLKPGNVMLTKTGAKLLDFGLAKPASAMAAGAAGSGQSQSVFAAAMTMTSPASPLTSAGSIVGTVQYMSPEQIEGREADARSDIFAFGLMLYEMAAGKRAFEGKTQASIVASILALEPPPITSIKPDVPAPLAKLIHTCLNKDAEERFQSAHDLKLQLELLRSITSSPATAASTTTRAGKFAWMQWAIAGVLAIAAAAASIAWWQSRNEVQPAVRALIAPPDKSSFEQNSMALSPDGRLLAFSALSAGGRKMLFLRPLNSLTPQPMAGTEGAEFPFWSPDSKHIAFFSNGHLRRVDAAGGPPQTICETQLGRGGTWNSSDVIVFAPGTNDELRQVTATGGTPKTAVPLDNTVSGYRWPQFLPDGKHFIFWTRSSEGPTKSGVYVGALGSNEHRRLMQSESDAVYANGRLLFIRDGALVSAPFDLRRLAITGDAVPIAESVAVDTSFNRSAFTASQTGTIVYFGREDSNGWPMLVFGKDGKVAGRVIPQAAPYTTPAFSSDGKRIAVGILEAGNRDIWVLDVQRGTRTRLTFEPTDELYPVWSADNSVIYYSSNMTGRSHIYSRAANGSSGQQSVVLETPNTDEYPASVSRDGHFLIYTRRETSKKYQVWALPLVGDRIPHPLMQTEFNQLFPEISPNGKWIAYMSDDAGHWEIYISPFSGGAKWQVSTDGGNNPKWSPDGKKLYFVDKASNGRVMAVDVRENGTAVELSSPQALVTQTSGIAYISGPLAIAPDGRILVNGAHDSAEGSAMPLTLVTNWPAELKK